MWLNTGWIRARCAFAEFNAWFAAREDVAVDELGFALREASLKRTLVIRFFEGILCVVVLIKFISTLWFNFEELVNWFVDWFKAQSTDANLGSWLLGLFLECCLIGGKLDLFLWVSCLARYLPFRSWNDCLHLLVLRLAREVLSGNCDAGSTYFKLL